MSVKLFLYQNTPVLDERLARAMTSRITDAFFVKKIPKVWKFFFFSLKKVSEVKKKKILVEKDDMRIQWCVSSNGKLMRNMLTCFRL